MFRFFRQIRQRLLTDNKLSKYLLYAVGEILLVVMGILIALQVNSWNEAKQEDRLAREYLTSLRSDLVQDTILIRKKYPGILGWQNELMVFKQKTESTTLTKDSLIQLAQYEFDPGRPLPKPYHKNTLTTLLSTGHIRLIPKELLGDILNYYAFMDVSVETLKISEVTYQSALSTYTEKYSFQSDVAIKDGPLLNHSIWDDVDLKDLAPRLSRLIKIKEGILYSKKAEFDSLLTLGTELIVTLDFHLKN